MAASVKGTKALEAVKQTTVVTTYTSGSPVAPVAGHIAVYFDLADADEHRSVEIANKLKTLVDRARELNYSKPTAAAIYLRCPLNGSKADIEVTSTSTDIIAGDVAIGISATVRSGESGSILFDSCFQQIMDKMWEQYGSADSSPTVKVNTGGTIEKGGTLPITVAMLRATDKDSSDPDLAFVATSGPLNGQLELTTAPGVAITEFTQEDINDGLLQYVHDDSSTITGAFVFSVSDGVNTLAAQDFAILVDSVAPTEVNNTGMTLLEGGTEVITAAMLTFTDVTVDDELLAYAVTSGPANGQLEDSGDPGVAITAFTQKNIDDGIIQYVHDDSDTITGAFGFSVSDGTNVLAAQTFSITVTPVAD